MPDGEVIFRYFKKINRKFPNKGKEEREGIIDKAHTKARCPQ